MTDVLRNVGELASPYYLLELWVRQWEIDLDPETYATLKRKTRSLVRDMRTFDHRGENVDDDWRARRREILGLVGVEERAREDRRWRGADRARFYLAGRSSLARRGAGSGHRSRPSRSQ